MLKKLKLIYLCFKHLKNPFEVIIGYLVNKPILAKTKINFRFMVTKGDMRLSRFLYVIENGWNIIYNKNKKEYTYKKGNIILIQNSIGAIHENLEKNYVLSYNLDNKVVLDIGGFVGDSAILFAKVGNVKKVIVYEPLKENITFIKKNIKVNNLQHKIILNEFGVGEKTETKIIESSNSPGSLGFGLKGNKYIVKLNLRSWEIVLQDAIKNKVYLAKVDCEGAEQYLTNVNKTLISKIPIWIIETHNLKIQSNVLKYFKDLKFNYKKISKLSKNIVLWEFKK